MPQHRIGKLLSSPQQSPAPRCQLMKTKRLQKAIVCPEVQTLHPLFYLAPSGQHQYGSLIELAAEFGQHLGPILSRKAQVKNDQVRPMLFGMHHRGLSVPHPPPPSPHPPPASAPSAETIPRQHHLPQSKPAYASPKTSVIPSATHLVTLRSGWCAITLVHPRQPY